MTTTPSTEQEDGAPGLLQDGSIRTTTGACNILIVAPNMAPTVDQNVFIGWLARGLVESLGAYGVINCGYYRLPVEGDSSPDELRIPDTGPENKKYKAVIALRQRLVKETGGIPVDLISYTAASVAAQDYLESIWLAACEIGWEGVPLVLFIQCMDDATAKALDVDVAIGAGRLTGETPPSGPDSLTVSPELLEELLHTLQSSRTDLKIREGVPGHALENRDHVAWWLRRMWNDHYDPSEDSWRAPEVNCLLMTLRCSGLREGRVNCENTARWLAYSISCLSGFRSIANEKKVNMPEKTSKSQERERISRGKQESVSPESASETLKPEALTDEQSPASTITSANEKDTNKRAVDDQLVRDAIDFISEKANEMVYRGSIEIGDYILEKFYGGDIEQARSKKPTKRASYAALCKNPDLVVHPTTLGIMVRVAAQEKFFDVQKLPTERLSYSHKAELVRLPDDQKKVALVKEAMEKPLSVKALRDRVRQSRVGLISHRGSTSTGGVKGGFDPERLLKDPVFSNEDELRNMDPQRREAFLKEIAATLDRLTNYTVQFRRLQKLLEPTAPQADENPE
jgi:hypothetical protein